jgi:hypothetical protein
MSGVMRIEFFCTLPLGGGTGSTFGSTLGAPFFSSRPVPGRLTMSWLSRILGKSSCNASATVAPEPLSSVIMRRPAPEFAELPSSCWMT